VPLVGTGLVATQALLGPTLAGRRMLGVTMRRDVAMDPALIGLSVVDVTPEGKPSASRVRRRGKQRRRRPDRIRSPDEFVKQDGDWLFAERRLMVDWTETRPSTM